MMIWTDISVPLKSGMPHWPGDPSVRIEKVRDMAKGDEANLSTLFMGSHAGTHMDAPLHFLSGGAGLDTLPLDAVIGEARVIEIEHSEFVSAGELGQHDIRKGERILLKTGNSARCWKSDFFVPDFVHLTTEAGHYLAGRGIRTVGIDYLSVGGYHAKGDEVHRALLQGGVWIIEGLDLSGVAPGTYELICLPLRVLNSDGAPARAVLGINTEAGHGSGF